MKAAILHTRFNVYLAVLLLAAYFAPMNAQSQQVSFQPSQTSGCAPLSVAFHNYSKNVVSCFWDFGNGATSVLNDASTVYLNPGSYTVKLVITYSNGSKDS